MSGSKFTLLNEYSCPCLFPGKGGNRRVLIVGKSKCLCSEDITLVSNPQKTSHLLQTHKRTRKISNLLFQPHKGQKRYQTCFLLYVRLTVYSISKLTLLLMIIGWSIIIPFARHKNKKNFNLKLQICVACLSARAEADHPSSPHCICFHFPPPPPGVTCFHFLSLHIFF